MNKPIDSESQSRQADEAPQPNRETQFAKPPYYQKSTKTYQEEIRGFNKKAFGRFFGIIGWTDTHNGFITAVATVVIAALTYSLAEDSARQARISEGTLKAIQGQLKVMQVDQRPWLAIHGISMTEDLQVTDFVEKGIVKDYPVIWIRLSIQVRNVGKSPARRVRIVADLAGDFNSDFLLKQENVCKVIRGEYSGYMRANGIVAPFEFTLLPNDDYNMPVIASSFRAGGSIIYKRKEDGRKILNTARVVGCVIYEFMDSNEPHITGFIYDIQSPDARQPIYADRGNVSAGQIRLVIPMEGTGPAN